MSGCFTHLVQDLDEDLHAADEDGGEGLDLVHTAGQALPVDLVGQVLHPLLHLPGDLAQARRQIFHELDQVLHGVDHLRHREIVQNLLTLSDDLADLGLVKTQKNTGSSLQLFYDILLEGIPAPSELPGVGLPNYQQNDISLSSLLQQQV